MNIENNKNKIDLVQQIGIDRTVTFDFTLKDADIEHLQTCKGVKLILNDNSPIQLENGSRISELVIKDKELGEFRVKFDLNNLYGTYYINSYLSTMVSDDNNNLQNLKAEAYKKRITNVFEQLEEKYKVIVDYSSIKIKKLELNATFFLDEPYEKYKQAILMIVRNVSTKRFKTKNNSNAIKYATWHEVNTKMGTDKLETVLVKNSSVELKIYSKVKQLQDIGAIPLDVDQNVMRIEYTINDRRILQNAFGSDEVQSITDEKINELFKRYFNRDVVSQYYTWRAKNQKELIELVAKHRELNPSRWVDSFIREVRQLEQLKGLPILFDVYDLKKVFNKLDKSKNGSKKFKRFLDKAVYENDLIGNTKRIQEIIDKVLSM